MKKNILLILCIALLPAVAWAQEKTLEDLNNDMLFMVESYASCAESESACTAADLQAIKSGAENSLRNLVGLLKSGDYSRMMLTMDQARALSMRAKAVQERLVHIEIGDEACNAAIYSFTGLLYSLYNLALFLNPIVIIIAIGYAGPIEVIREFIMSLISVPWFLLMTLVLWPSCLFWWL